MAKSFTKFWFMFKKVNSKSLKYPTVPFCSIMTWRKGCSIITLSLSYRCFIVDLLSPYCHLIVYLLSPYCHHLIVTLLLSYCRLIAALSLLYRLHTVISTYLLSLTIFTIISAVSFDEEHNECTSYSYRNKYTVIDSTISHNQPHTRCWLKIS